MNILNHIKEKLFYRSLQREKAKNHRKSAFLTFDDVKTVALINQGTIDAHQWNEQQKVYEHLKKLGKQVFMFTYCDEKMVPEHLKELHQRIILKNEINCCDIPSKEVQKDVVNQKVDLMIDVTQVSKKSTLFLLSIADARLRIGKNDELYQDYFDLLMDWKENEHVMDFIEHIIYYLQILKKPEK